MRGERGGERFKERGGEHPQAREVAREAARELAKSKAPNASKHETKRRERALLTKGEHLAHRRYLPTFIYLPTVPKSRNFTPNSHEVPVVKYLE